jgi:hypothetical protein
MKYFSYIVKIKNRVTEWNFVVISDEFNLALIYVGVDYDQKQISKQ